MATKIIKEIVTDVGGNTTIEYSDDTLQKYNVADVVTAQTNPVTGGISLSAGGVDVNIGGPSLRNVATRCSVANSFNGSNKQSMSRSRHRAADVITSLKILYGNWKSDDYTVGDSGPGATSTYSASIEYPAGVFTQVKFAGLVTGVAADVGEVISDFVSVYIPKNAYFWVRTWYSNSLGIIYIGKPADTAHGEAMDFGVTVVDKTMSGTISDGAAGIVTPYAILSISAAPSIFIAGDSRCFGQSDAYTGAVSSDVGTIARSIGPELPYINCGIPSDSAFKASALSALRISLAKRFCTHVICGYGINDINLYVRTAAQTLADLKTVWGLYSPLTVYQATVGPVSTSTDSWATTGNQTTAATNAQRVLLNNSIRQSPAVAGVLEVADVEETARDSGIWKAPGFTADGLHETQLACVVVANSGAVNVGRFK